jgi:hypothetical protein
MKLTGALQYFFLQVKEYAGKNSRSYSRSRSRSRSRSYSRSRSPRLASGFDHILFALHNVNSLWSKLDILSASLQRKNLHAVQRQDLGRDQCLLIHQQSQRDVLHQGNWGWSKFPIVQSKKINCWKNTDITLIYLITKCCLICWHICAKYALVETWK